MAKDYGLLRAVAVLMLSLNQQIHKYVASNYKGEARLMSNLTKKMNDAKEY